MKKDIMVLDFGVFRIRKPHQESKVIHPKYTKHSNQAAKQSHLGRYKMGWFMAD